ncbi:MAG: hypothetical protein M9899_00160 [Bdellovibrionaceae bacterium]|nr:hypothetical protein [Pseudobdellovibrionaceae bacterium]
MTNTKKQPNQKKQPVEERNMPQQEEETRRAGRESGEPSQNRKQQR